VKSQHGIYPPHLKYASFFSQWSFRDAISGKLHSFLVTLPTPPLAMDCPWLQKVHDCWHPQDYRRADNRARASATYPA
jgi:hypothetical protein